MRKYLILTLWLILSVRCINMYNYQPYQQSTATYNLANMYNPSATTIFPKFILYNQNDTTSIVYTYLFLPQLMFKNVNNQKQAKVYLNIKITPSFENRITIDSISKTFTIKQNPYSKSLTFPTKIKTPDSSTLVNIYIKDLYRNKANIAFIWNDKSSVNAPNNFIVKYSDDLQPVFTKYVLSEYSYYVLHNTNPDSLYMFHYIIDTTVAPPPYVRNRKNRQLYADTVTQIPTDSALTFQKPGIYLFSTTNNDKQGKSIFYFYEDFPLIKRASQMIPPLEYLTSYNEFKKITSAYSPKLAVDSFWLAIANNPSAAKNLIKNYYTRVYLANYYFTSYKEGWKTDRGMIYIIFGRPDVVNKYDDKEVWYYSLNADGSMLQFTFKKVKNKFSDNHYVLQPLGEYKSYWNHAIKMWRQGIAYNL